MARSRKSEKAKHTAAQKDEAQEILENKVSSEDADKAETTGDIAAEQQEVVEEALNADDARVVEETSAELTDEASGAEKPADVIDGEVTTDEPLPETEDTAKRDAAEDAPEASETDDRAETSDTSETGELTEAEELEAKTDETAQDSDEIRDDVLADTTEIDDVQADLEAKEASEKPAAKPEPKPEPEVVRGSMWPAVFGGVIAAMLGFVAGRGDMIDQYLPGSMQRGSVDITALEEQLDARTAELEAELDERAAAIAAQAERLEALESESDAEVVEKVTALEAELDTLTALIADIESAPVAPAAPGVDPEQVSELEASIAAQEAQLAALAERAAAAEANAESEAARILASAALLRVVTALDSGEPYADALTELEAVAPVDIPETLAEASAEGVPTMAALQDSFPDAARAALLAARSDIPDGETATFTAFLQRQLNVRSVVPREGDSADAILSRAEAAVRDGDLALALSELEGLSEGVASTVDEWVAAATARLAAKDAANALADSLSSN